MQHRRPNRGRRTFIIGAGALAAAGTAGLLAWATSDREPLAEAPAGWFLISRRGGSDAERVLTAWSDGQGERIVAEESGTAFLSAAVSPDGRFLALLKRVSRGSMPTDSVTIYERESLRLIATTEVQIAFQRSPTFSIGWSADAARLAVSYNGAGQTLLFGVSEAGRVGLQSMLRRAYFQFHPLLPEHALYETPPGWPDTVNIATIAAGRSEQLIERFAGSAAQWSPDGARLAYLQGSDGALLIRDEATRQTIASFQTHVIERAWSPDSRRLAVFSMADGDPLKISALIPEGVIPGLTPPAAQPRLFIYDLADGRTTTIRDLPERFQLARLIWLSPDWLLVLGIPSKQSFITDRRGEQRRPVTALDDYRPLVGWIAAQGDAR